MCACIVRDLPILMPAVDTSQTVSDVLHTASTMLSHEATVQSVQNTVYAHPTLSEALGEAAHAVYGMAIHY